MLFCGKVIFVINIINRLIFMLLLYIIWDRIIFEKGVCVMLSKFIYVSV